MKFSGYFFTSCEDKSRDNPLERPIFCTFSLLFFMLIVVKFTYRIEWSCILFWEFTVFVDLNFFTLRCIHPTTTYSGHQMEVDSVPET